MLGMGVLAVYLSYEGYGSNCTSSGTFVCDSFLEEPHQGGVEIHLPLAHEEVLPELRVHSWVEPPEEGMGYAISEVRVHWPNLRVNVTEA